jgi:anti-sigma factor RsiW
MAVSSASTWLVVSSLDDSVLEQVVDSHTRAMLTARPTDVASTEQHIVKPWFNDKLTFAPTVIDLQSDGYPLAGARIDVIAAKPVATLVYNRRLHRISLFARPDRGPTASLISHRAVQGLNVVSWKQNDVEYWAVSDLNSKELAEFADLIRNASRR